MIKTHGTMDQFEAQVRARITELDPAESVESATNTCGIAAKPDVVQSTTYIDNDGVLGEPGERYTYDELWEIWDDNHEADPVMEEYDSFDYWFNDTKKWLTVEAASDIVPDNTTVVVEGAYTDGYLYDENNETESEYISRFIHSMIPEIKRRASNAAEIYDIHVDGDEVVCIFDNDIGTDKELRIPADELFFDWEHMDDDINNIVNQIVDFDDGSEIQKWGDVPMPEDDDMTPIDECDNPILSGSTPYGHCGHMLIEDENILRSQYYQGELSPAEIVEGLGYEQVDDHTYIKDLGDCQMVFDFEHYDTDVNDEYIAHYFTDASGRVPSGYTVTKMYL